MLLSKTVTLHITARNITRYRQLGYNAKFNEELIVNVDDLSDSCGVIVDCLCDYCFEEGIETIVPRIYHKYLRDNVNGIIHKDTCKKCQGKKLKESNLKTIGKETNLKPIGDLKRLDGNYIYNTFINKGLIPLFKPEDYVSNSQELPYICPKHKSIGTQYKRYGNLSFQKYFCRQCYIDNYKKEKNPSWKGGITPLKQYLRGVIADWKNNSMYNSSYNSSYKCVITDNRFDHVHHLYGFDLIILETLQETNIKIKEIMSNYTDEELTLLKNKCIEIHNRYPLGVCLCIEIHKLFHFLYGRGHNTPEQFEEFKARLKLGEFNLFLQENKLNLTF